MHKEILVIDDNPDIRLLVSNILKEQNFLVRTAANYDQAVFEINKKLPDLAIIDIKLDKPDLDGIDLLKLITNKNKESIEGADYYLSGNVNNEIQNIQSEYINKDIFIIGGSEIINLTFNLIEQFYLTRIYGNYNCEKFIDVSLIENNLNMIKKIDGDSTCHFEIWEK